MGDFQGDDGAFRGDAAGDYEAIRVSQEGRGALMA